MLGEHIVPSIFLIKLSVNLSANDRSNSTVNSNFVSRIEFLCYSNNGLTAFSL
jgi:hypothetical protein